MKNDNNSGSGDDSRDFTQEGQSLDELVANAVEAAAKGENIEQVLEVMLASLSGGAKEKARKKFTAGLSKRGLRQPSAEVPDLPSRATVSRIRSMLFISTRQMVERIMRLVRSRPDIAAQLQQAGKALTQSGVLADKVTSISEGDLGTIAPSATTGKSQTDRGAGRGA